MGVHEIEELIAMVRLFPSESHLIGPRDPTLVDAAEARLGVVFSPLSRRFLLEFGALSVGGAGI